ncbi:hypothetical protein L1787_16695 [Acuticoccus sp. M5D2P5]|uniref:hypothetical protein n=1 Tax=Acuticoccus kalidii TaxID=2910977 RepID=UPI001F38FE84|nr:hypothetical protein [Acuticoccus kalidii]MCF3935044.1 hypothetical protein [Acuticoccus kalidii]
MIVRRHTHLTPLFLAFMASKGCVPSEGKSAIECSAAFRRRFPNSEYLRFHERMMDLAAEAGCGVRRGSAIRSVVDMEAFLEFVWARVERDADPSVIAALDALPWSEVSVSRAIAEAAA